MAELHVQPKNSRPWWLWLLLALVALGLLFFLMRGCDRDDDVDTATTETTTATDTTTTTTTTTETITTDDDWNSLNWDVPVVTYDEITDKDIEVRGNEDYTIYSIEEPILFGLDKSNIRPEAADKLKHVAASLGKRYNGGQVRIFGYTDAQGSANYNKELAEKRAEAVQNWLTENGQVSKDAISLHPVGEARPAASNATKTGRAQNRRVEIVARRAE